MARQLERGKRMATRPKKKPRKAPKRVWLSPIKNASIFIAHDEDDSFIAYNGRSLLKNLIGPYVLEPKKPKRAR